MITYVRGNLFESPAQVLVNTVNTDGVMGKGVALQFKRIFPEMFHEYQMLCEEKKLDVGRLHLFKTPHKWILNFPTKRHWRRPSRVEYVEAGLKTFVRSYSQAGIYSIAFPPLGCGNGQLDFRTQVGPLMTKHLERLPIDVFIYPERPQSGPPEHLNADDVAAWLRSEPRALSFDEVWRDVTAIVNARRSFHTSTGSTFIAHVLSEDPPGLRIEAGEKSSRIEADDLLEFWQQLRQHGFTHRRIAAQAQRLSYLMPIFEQLPYVQRVAISTTDEGLTNKASSALQVRPRARLAAPISGDLFTDVR
jgi:O-acetyl-ADP-ribose deacetylase (regulator of RNase III)